MFNICIIGSGFSGICAGAQLQKQFNKDCEFVIFDENPDFGGVWLLNTYPGCASDVPSHLYSYSFELNPYWSKKYCSQPEILEYLKNIAHKYDLYSHAKFNHKILSVIWDESILQWRVSVKDNVNRVEQELLFAIVINAKGRFHEAKIPDEFLTFEGDIIHSAKWDNDVKIEGRTVAVVGSGSSAAQIIPSIADKVKRLVVYQRHAAWIIPRSQFTFSSFAKWCFANIPGVVRIYRCYIRWVYEKNFPVFRVNTFANKMATRYAKSHLKKQVPNTEIRQKLTPNFAFGCKRIIPTSDYFPVFNSPNVEIITDTICQVTKDSIVTKKDDKLQEEKTDVLILATGFQSLNFFGDLTIRGIDDEDIAANWLNDKPKSYLGVISSIAPNFFFLLGPNTATGYTSVLESLECQVNWIIKIMKEMKSKGLRYVRVKTSVEDAYMAEVQRLMGNTVYTSTDCGNCGTWYRNHKGVVVEFYPNTTSSYRKRTQKVKPLEFEWK